MPVAFYRPIAAFILVSAGVLLLSAPPARAAMCDRVAAPNGSDHARGTPAAPYRTPQKLVHSLRAGQNGCLRAGVYSEDVTMDHGGGPGNPILVRSYPGEKATIEGRLYLARGAQYVTIANLNLVGLEHGHACPRMCPSPSVNADHTIFYNDNVTNNHAGTICFVLGDSNGLYGSANYTTIEHSRIHDCGKLPATNYDHGIYMEETYGSRILDNVIYSNADRGIQLYPHAEGSLIAGNIIYGNGEGIDFGADGAKTTNNNAVQGNIIADSKVLYNVMSAYGSGAVGSGNVVAQNCIGGGRQNNASNPGGISHDHTGFAVFSNVLAAARFVNPARGNFELARRSRCRRLWMATASRVR